MKAQLKLIKEYDEVGVGVTKTVPFLKKCLQICTDSWFSSYMYIEL
jgi:hypothetical protein